MPVNEPHLQHLPKHLQQYIVDQDYKHYTPVDHAIWRYVMRQNRFHLSRVAHESYLDGLEKTGIETESISSMYGMNRILKNIGWAAVAVDGFIPPAAFMEFQAHKVLVIAADIRTLEHIQYTPAPDIIHEAAGHAPIIAVPEYAEYLINFGKIGSKAFSSRQDYQLYEAIRHLSIIKEDPQTSAKEIEEGEYAIEELQRNMGEPSEMAQLRNLHWWTVEFGLIGTLENPRIYGAGLLSSIGESMECLKPHVKKIPYSIEAAAYNFDITKPQPHLFVTPDFNYLNQVLEKFSEKMALKKGGALGISRAVESGNTATAEFNNALQLSSMFKRYLGNDDGLGFLCEDISVSLGNKEVARLTPGWVFTAENALINDLSDEFCRYTPEEYDLNMDEPYKISFENRYSIKGKFRRFIKDKKGENLLAVFEEGVLYRDDLPFENAERIYLIFQNSIKSVFSGPADVNALIPETQVPKEKTHKIVYTPEQIELQQLYGIIRTVRHKKAAYNQIRVVWEKLKTHYLNDWLLPLEILEILASDKSDPDMQQDIRQHLEILAVQNPSCAQLVNDGLFLINEEFN